MPHQEIFRRDSRSLILKHGFWFIDIPRTSSSSVRAELAIKFGSPFGKGNLIEKEYATEQFLPDHLTAQELLEFLGKSNWTKIFTFTIVRNPWDRILSMYHYRRKIKGIPFDWTFRDYVIKLDLATPDTDFFRYYGHRFGASDFILDADGKVLVDYVAKYENRENDIKIIGSRCGFEELGSLAIQSASPENAHYSAAYDDETRDIIGNKYRKDVELFGYEF